MADITSPELFMYVCIAMTDEIKDQIAAEVNDLPEFKRGEVTREEVHEAMMYAARQPLETLEALIREFKAQHTH